MVEAGVVKNNSDLVVCRLAYQTGQGQGDLLGVLVALDGVDAHLLAGQAQGAEERLGRAFSVDIDLGPTAGGQPHTPGDGLVLDAHLVDGVDLPAPGQQVGDLLTDLVHSLSDGGLVTALIEGSGSLKPIPTKHRSSW